MALSNKAKEAIRRAVTEDKAAEELIAAIEAAGAAAPEAANVPDITSTNLVGVDGTGSNAAPLAGTETRLDAIESKINAVLASLQAAGLMA